MEQEKDFLTSIGFGPCLYSWSMRTIILLFSAICLASCAHRYAVGPLRKQGPPYSQGFVAGKTLFVSGQIGIKNGKLVSGGIEAETRQALRNLERVLEKAGFKKKDIVRCNVFLTDIGDYQAMNRAYASFFGAPPYPSRACVAVKELVLGAKVEISAVAVKD